MDENIFLTEEEIEEALLGALLIDDEAIIKVIDILKPEDFLKKENQIVYQVILELFEKRIGIDMITVSTRLKEKKLIDSIGGQGYLVYLIHKAPNVSNVVSYAKLIKTKKARRDLLEISKIIQELAKDETKDAEELIDEVEKNIFKVAERVYPYEFTNIGSLLDESLKRIEELQKGRIIRGVPTGFSKLDEYLGGLQKSDLIILASRPSQGKTALALNIARYLAVQENIPVGIFSLEMSKDQIIDRLIAAEAGVSLWKLRTGRLVSEGDVDELALVYEAAERLKNAPIFIDDSPSLNNLQIRTMSRKLKHEIGELGLLVIDYLQLIRSSRIIENRVQEVSEISKSLKELARELEIPVLAISQLSRAPEQRVSQIPRLSDLRESGCLSYDSLITNAETGELLKIGELVGKKDIPVFSLDENWNVVKGKISKVFCSGEKMIYELRTRSGFKIKASANHPFRKIDGWYRLDELKIGDRIAVAKEIQVSNPKNEMTNDEIILLAHLIGDGCVLPRQPIHYTSADFFNISVVAQTAHKLFSINPRIVRQKNWWHVYLPSPYKLTRNKHHPIVEWFYSLGIKPAHSYEKEIPQKVFSLSKENLALFLKHLWATDGNVSIKILKNRKPSGEIYYSTTSGKIAQEVKYLLLSFGIRSKIGVIKKKNFRPCYQVVIQGKEDQLKFLQEIGVYGQKSIIIPQLINYLNEIKPNPNVDVVPKEFWQKIALLKNSFNLSWRDFARNYGMSYCGSTLLKHGISKNRLLKIAEFMPHREIINLANSQIFWDEIIEIRPLGVEKVYDATVPIYHNFLANGIFVHNSLEQDSDVVMFIHRPKEAGTNLPTNQVNIIIAKHRNGPIGSIDLYFDPETVSFYSLETQPEEIEFH